MNYMVGALASVLRNIRGTSADERSGEIAERTSGTAVETEREEPSNASEIEGEEPLTSSDIEREDLEMVSPRKNAAERFREAHREQREGRARRDSPGRGSDRCPRLHELKTKRSIGQPKPLPCGKQQSRGDPSVTSLCPDCVRGIMERRRRTSTRISRRTSYAKPTHYNDRGTTTRHRRKKEDVSDSGDESNGSNDGKSNVSEADDADENAQPQIELETAKGVKMKLRIKFSQCSLCPECVGSLMNMNITLKERRDNEPIPAKARQKRQQSVQRRKSSRQRPLKADLGVNRASKCVLIDNLDDALREDPRRAGRVVPLYKEDRRSRESDGDEESKSASEESREPSVSTQKSFPSMSDQPMVKDVANTSPAIDKMKHPAMKRAHEEDRDSKVYLVDDPCCSKRQKLCQPKPQEPEKPDQTDSMFS